jgi:hypothetical protein
MRPGVAAQGAPRLVPRASLAAWWQCVFRSMHGQDRTFDGLLGSLLRMLGGGFEFDYLTHRNIYV